MRLLLFLSKYSPKLVVLAVLAGIAAGASNAGIIALIHTRLVAGGAPAWRLLAGFICLCVTLTLARICSQVLMTYMSQKAIRDLRIELSTRILAAPLRRLEEIGPARLLASLTDDVVVISNGLVTIPVLCLHGTIVIGSLIYLGLLSWAVLAGVVAFIVIGVTSFQLAVNRATRSLSDARRQQDLLFNHLRALIEGTKELKLHSARREAFMRELLEATSSSYQRHNIKGSAIYAAAGSGAMFLFFILIGLLLFALPAVKEVSAETLTGYVLVLLYLVVPLDVLSSSVPSLARAAIALTNIESFGLALAESATESPDGSAQAANPTWRSVELTGVTHTYYREKENESFTLGPIDMALSPGEIVFLVGGNGSGKTTLAKLLVGLYLPESGEIHLDGRLIDDRSREAFRQYFSVVFSDFYLFEALLGLRGGGLDGRAEDYLQRLQLDHKVAVKDGVLSTINLSQGQRKRLALLTAYLEDRPIYVFDEWAADQDPIFKQVFYESLLPELKARGKAAIVITHDDKYYYLADRIIKLDYGRLDNGSVRGAQEIPARVLVK